MGCLCHRESPLAVLQNPESLPLTSLLTQDLAPGHYSHSTPLGTVFLLSARGANRPCRPPTSHAANRTYTGLDTCTGSPE